MKTLFFRSTIFTLSLLFSVLAFGVTLGDAKSQGLVGEQPDGLLGIVENSAEVAALVEDINSRRMAAYRKIATKNSTDVEAVKHLAGKKAIEKTQEGQFVRLPSGKWVKVK